MFRILVTGSRDWSLDDSDYIHETLDSFHKKYGISVIIEGCARGVDSIAEDWALRSKITDMHFPADWDNPKYRNASGNSFAGNVRNGEMITFGEPDIVYAFHRDFNNSRGTKDMVAKARKADLPVEIFP